MKKFTIVLALITTLIFADTSKEQFVLTMSKDDGMCQDFLQKFNDDLEKFGGLKPEDYKEIKTIKWTEILIKSPRVSNLDIRFAEIDLNHDDIIEMIVFHGGESTLGGILNKNANSIYVVDKKFHTHLKKAYEKLRNLYLPMNPPYFLEGTLGSLINIKGIKKSFYLHDEGIRLMRYQGKDFLMYFGLKEINYHKTSSKLFEKDYILISKLSKKLYDPFPHLKKFYKREDICLYKK